jgi:hypothetical protein
MFRDKTFSKTEVYFYSEAIVRCRTVEELCRVEYREQVIDKKGLVVPVFN